MMQYGKTYFLALTSLEAYWDKSLPLLFLTKGCLRLSSTSKYRLRETKTVADPWSERHALLAAREYSENLFKRLLPELRAVLNAIHEVDYSERYWEILLGAWLRIYIATLYDRYTCLRLAYASYPDIKTTTLSTDSYAIAKTPQEFNSFLITDYFNLQLLSYVLDYFDVPTNKVYADVREQIQGAKQKPSLFRKILSMFFKKMGDPAAILFCDSGVSFKTQLQLFLKSSFNIVPVTYNPKPNYKLDIDWRLRRQFAKIVTTNSDFEKCLIQSLPYFMPASFIENYERYAAKTKMATPPKVLFSAMGWHYNEMFKHTAAYLQERGTQLIGHQHGGDYGILAYHASEIHESRITDQFLTWGWDGDSAHIKPFSGLKLRETKLRSRVLAKPRLRRKKRDSHFLYGTANGRRYLLRFNYSLTSILNYFDQQKVFLQTLNTDITKKLKIRIYPADWGWDRALRFNEINPNLSFQSHHIPFPQALSKCELYIADHISTTFAESLAVNQPTLLFTDPQMWDIREAAQPYFDELKEVGVYFTDPLSAAKALNQIETNVDDWWNETKRVQAISRFRDRFCNVASNELEEWIRLFSTNAEVPICDG